MAFVRFAWVSVHDFTYLCERPRTLNSKHVGGCQNYGPFLDP